MFDSYLLYIGSLLADEDPNPLTSSPSYLLYVGSLLADEETMVLRLGLHLHAVALQLLFKSQGEQLGTGLLNVSLLAYRDVMRSFSRLLNDTIHQSPNSTNPTPFCKLSTQQHGSIQSHTSDVDLLAGVSGARELDLNITALLNDAADDPPLRSDQRVVDLGIDLHIHLKDIWGMGLVGDGEREGGPGCGYLGEGGVSG